MGLNEIEELYQTVIKNDYCIGCGACASLKHSPFKIEFDNYGNYIACLNEYKVEDIHGLMKICPFSNDSLNENQLGELFLADAPSNHPLIGRYYNCFAGFVMKKTFREEGSSGGIGKWIGYKLLEENLIDFFVHVTPSKDADHSNSLFEYSIINKAEKVLSGSKSSYYPVRLDDVLSQIKNIDGRFAITGVPCFIKAIRLLMNNDNELKSKIKFTIGLFCGGMKSANHAKMIAWQLGIEPEDLDGIDFRGKPDNGPATHKIYKVWSKNRKVENSMLSHQIFGTGWNGYFTPNACFYCDDVVSELADLSIGDAWLPKYINDTSGTNILIVRNQRILDLIERSIAQDEIYLEKLSPEEVVKSQAGGFRQRRDALSLRIQRKEGRKEWYPPKRVNPNEYEISKKRRRIYRLREKIAVRSHITSKEALQKNDYNYFIRKMKPLEMRYLIANTGYQYFFRLILSTILKRIFRR